MEPQILDVLGVEIELRTWRDTDYTWEATLTTEDGAPIDLTSSEVGMTIAERAGGTVKYSQVNAPPVGHTDPGNGVTRFTVPSSIYSGLSGQRAYTWKYQIYRKDLITGKRNVHFYGDYRVMATYAVVPA